MEKILRQDCDFLRLVLMAILSKTDITTTMLGVCDECPLKTAREKTEKCLGDPPTKVEDIIDEEK